MVKHITLSNFEIYSIARQIMQMQQDENYANKVYPVKINFYLQKNQSTLLEMAQEIEKERMAILTKFQNPNAENVDSTKIIIADDDVEQANQELQDLFDLEQEVTIYTIDLDVFDNIDMTPSEFQAINFMITENFIEEE